jgi:hypothetical protein
VGGTKIKINPQFVNFFVLGLTKREISGKLLCNKSMKEAKLAVLKFSLSAMIMQRRELVAVCGDGLLLLYS